MEALQPFLLPALILIVFIVTILALKSNYEAGGSSRTQITGLIESAALAKNSSDWEQASMLYSRALDLIDNMRSLDESLLSECLVNYATALDRSGKRLEAESQRKRLIDIWMKGLERGDSDLMTEVDYLCTNAEFGAQTMDVANYYEKLLAAREKTHSPNSDTFINTVVIYSRLMRTLGENEIADKLQDHADNLRKGGSNLINSKPALEKRIKQPHEDEDGPGDSDREEEEDDSDSEI